MHRLLMDRGFYEQGTHAKGYWQIIKQACSQ